MLVASGPSLGSLNPDQVTFMPLPAACATASKVYVRAEHDVVAVASLAFDVPPSVVGDVVEPSFVALASARAPAASSALSTTVPPSTSVPFVARPPPVGD